MFPTLHHPNLFIWDFWYYYASAAKLFHVFYLNADPGLVAAGKHHWASQVGYGVTKDFTSMDWGPSNVLTASADRWDNSSIWTGDIVRIKKGFLMFYTSRNRETDDGKTQNIGIASANRVDAPNWEPLPDIRIQPDGFRYTPRHVPRDVTIHAWRDPFVFRYKGQCYLLISAKSRHSSIGRNGVIALLRSTNGGFRNWEYLDPIANTGYYSEMEVPQILKNHEGGFELVFSTGPNHDKSPGTSGSGGLYSIHLNQDFSTNTTPRLLLPFIDGLYACRIIPELNGEIVGFDHQVGGIRRSGFKTYYQSVDRNFENREC